MEEGDSERFDAHRDQFADDGDDLRRIERRDDLPAHGDPLVHLGAQPARDERHG